MTIHPERDDTGSVVRSLPVLAMAFLCGMFTTLSVSGLSETTLGAPAAAFFALFTGFAAVGLAALREQAITEGQR